MTPDDELAELLAGDADGEPDSVRPAPRRWRDGCTDDDGEPCGACERCCL